MATDPDLCMLACVVISTHKKGKLDSVLGMSVESPDQESEVLRATWCAIREAYHAQSPLVGFNSMSFDIPVLVRRAMLLDIGVAPGMIAGLQRRQEQNHNHYDLMNLLGLRSPFSGKIEARGLNYYLRLFGLGSKTPGMDGSLVFPAWKEGRHDEILEYCRQDVLKTAALFQRVAPWIIVAKEINSTKEKEKVNV